MSLLGIFFNFEKRSPFGGNPVHNYDMGRTNLGFET